MTSYIIKSILCSGILLLCYRFLLEKEKMFQFNRIYLLLSILFSLIIPLITIEIEQNSAPVEVAQYIPNVHQSLVATETKQLITRSENYELPESSARYLYLLVTSFLFLRLGINLRSVLITKKNKEILRFKDYKLVLLTENAITFTFLDYIFVSKDAYQNNRIEKEILVHELAHVKQKHSLDILFIEVVQALFWFNPLLFFYKKSIQLNHEFLADQAVLKTKTNVKSYQLLLIDKILYTRQIGLTSSFNYSITKKRLAMMTKSTSRTRQILKKSIIAMLSLGLIFAFCEKIYSQAQNKTSQEPGINKTEIKEKGNFQSKKINKQKAPVSDPIIVVPSSSKSGPGISEDLVEEFNQSVKKYAENENASNGKSYKTFNQMPVAIKKRLYDLYIQMNRQQQDETKLLFFESPVPVKKAPSKVAFESWKDPKMFGVWIDNKKVSNAALNKYKASDIAEWWSSKLYTNARKGKIYKYQLDLTTNQEFDKTYDARVKDRIAIGSQNFLQY